VTEAGGIPLGVVAAPANRRDDRLLAATLDTVTVIGVLPTQPVVHLDAGYDYQPCRHLLAERGMLGQIATRGLPAPIQASQRWPVERTHAWGNQYGKLRWCTERRRVVVAFGRALANPTIVCGRLMRRAWTCYRWEGRPRRRP
jgi:Transposase DDE domain